jgi:hypothetical protein
MKKITLVLAFIGMIILNSCTREEVQDNDTIAEVFELRNVNLLPVGGGVYEIFRQLNPNILSSDQILIYRMTNTVNSSTPIWQLIPRTIYFSNNDELDYDFDFSRVDFSITASGNYDLSTRPIYLNNQTFRIVIIPGYFSGRFDTSNINTVMNLIGKTEADVKIMN